MTDTAKHYNYYIASKEDSAPIIKNWRENVKKPRDEVLQKLLDDTGAEGWTETSVVGSSVSVVSNLVFDSKHEILKFPHIMTVRSQWQGQDKKASVRGKKNSKAGKAFNSVVDAANKKLEHLPDFSDWLTSAFNVNESGIIAGTYLARTSCGVAGCRMVIKVPIVGDSQKSPGAPFNKVTYGEFWDLVNSESAE